MNREEKIKDLQRQLEVNLRRIKKLNNSLEELKAEPVFKEGDWVCYISNAPWGNGHKVFQVDHLSEDYLYVKVLYKDQLDKWDAYISDFRTATPEEVETALIEEAKRRGFKEGVMFYYCNGGSKGIIGEYVDETYFYDNQLRFKGSTILENGKWAEIITEPKVVVNGYEMEELEWSVKFGCASIYKDELQDILRTCKRVGLKGNRKIKSITLDSGVEITVEQLKEICDNIK